MKTWYSINASAADVAEITIYDEIGFWGVTAEQFLTNLASIKAPTVRLSINSPGGSVMDALAIFNGLRQSGKRIEVMVMGVAASASSYVAMAGDHITMPENTFMFLHRPIGGAYGNADDMRDMADVLDKFNASLTATYAKRWKGTPEALDKVLADETFLTAAECLANGLCDEVTDAISIKARFELDRTDLPANVLAALRPQAVPPAPAAAALADQIMAAVRAAGVEALAKPLLADAQIVGIDQVHAAVSNAVEVKALCGALQMADRADEFIQARSAYADVRAQINAEMVAADEAARIKTTPTAKPAQPAGGFNVLALWDHIHSMEKKQ